jgi:hypothetical protein
MALSADYILSALVLVLSRQINEEKLRNGVQRVGGDYTEEAIDMIKRGHPDIWRQFQTP